MSARPFNRSGMASFAQADGSSFARASFNFILLVIGAALAVSFFAFSVAVFFRVLILAVVSVFLLTGLIILCGLILSEQFPVRPGLSAA